jgi:hypothetical protein
MINVFGEFVKDHYRARREAAGFNGSSLDGGYHDAIALINAFELGRSGHDLSHVSEFKHLICDFDNQKDPEFAEFLRLQQKFTNQ